MSAEIDPQKIITNINNLLRRASGKQLRLIYLLSYEIIKK